MRQAGRFALTGASGDVYCENMAYMLFLILVAVFSLFAWHITRKEKRSFRSWLGENLLKARLKKGWFNAHEEPSGFLAKRLAQEELPYVLPPPLKLLGVIERTRMEGLDCVLLSERAGTTRLRILYLHGGAYVDQPLLPHWLFLDRINNQCKAVVTVPLYPKAPWHTVDDTFGPLVNLYRRMLEQSRAQDVVIMGDSAGGGLALALAQQIGIEGLARPKALVLISPWLDITLRNASIDAIESLDPMLSRRFLQVVGASWAGHQDVHSRLVSPINGPVDQLPPVSLFVGTHELLLADARKFVVLCRRKGVRVDYHEYAKMNHDFPLFPIPEARKAQQEIVRIIRG